MKKNKEWVRILKFVLFSASAGVIQFGSFALLNELLLAMLFNIFDIKHFVELHLQPSFHLQIQCQHHKSHAASIGVLCCVHTSNHMPGRLAS
jgi:hypothetical protein